VFYVHYDSRAALSKYEQAAAQCPASYETLMKRTRGLIDVGNETDDAKAAKSLWKRALRDTDSLQRRYPDSAQSYFLQGTAAGLLAKHARGARKLALARLVGRNAKKATELAPTFAPGLVLLGTYYREVASASRFLKGLARLFRGGLPDGTLADSERVLRMALLLSP
jgi:tetratricopeptide (TPR) repeat protein